MTVPEYDPYANLAPPHLFERDPHDAASCLVCGDVNGFGVLHLTETGRFDYDLPDVDPICRGCWHPRHAESCRVSLSPVRSVPCKCEAGAA